MYTLLRAYTAVLCHPLKAALPSAQCHERHPDSALVICDTMHSPLIDRSRWMMRYELNLAKPPAIR